MQCFYNISEKKSEMMLIFLHVDKHQSFLQVDLNILGIKVYYKLILSTKHSESTQTQLAQRRCDNVVTTSLLTLSQRCGTVENESCADVGFQRCDNFALRRYQDVAETSPQH